MNEYKDDIYFFFFQAEDGIRDYKVTGVQTCALPISPRAAVASTDPTGRSPRRGSAPCASARLRAVGPTSGSGRSARAGSARAPRSRRRRQSRRLGRRPAVQVLGPPGGAVAERQLDRARRREVVEVPPGCAAADARV